MHWRFTGKPHHRIWGWLQIGQIIDLGPDGTQVTTQHPWLRAHPHARPGWSHPNVLYVASESLTIDGRHLPLPGHGTLKRGHGLTAPATNGTQANCSLWRLPDWLNPKRGGTGLTYHPLARWNDDGTLRSAPRGQEFVCLPPRTPQIAAWITTLLTNTLV